MYIQFTLTMRGGAKIIFRVSEEELNGLAFASKVAANVFLDNVALKKYFEESCDLNPDRSIENLKKSLGEPDGYGRQYVNSNYGFFLDALAYFKDHGCIGFTAIRCDHDGSNEKDIPDPAALFDQVVAKHRQYEECPAFQFAYLNRKAQQTQYEVRDHSAHDEVRNVTLSGDHSSLFEPAPLHTLQNLSTPKKMSPGWKIAMLVLLSIALVLLIGAVTWGTIGLLTAPTAIFATNAIIGIFGLSLLSIPKAAFIATLVSSAVLSLVALSGILYVAKQPTRESVSVQRSASATYAPLPGSEEELNHTDNSYGCNLFNCFRQSKGVEPIALGADEDDELYVTEGSYQSLESL